MTPASRGRQTDVDEETEPGARVTVVAGEGAEEVVLRRITGVRPDLDFVESLARLHLAAARLGIRVRLRDPCPTLARVLDLVGLAEPLRADRELGVEVEGEPGVLELRGVEEVGPADDLAP